MAAPPEKKELPSFQFLKQQAQSTLESHTIPEQGVNFQLQKGVTNFFQMTYGMNFCNPNPYFGMQQGMPETLPSNWEFGAVTVGDCMNADGSPKEPGFLMQINAKPNTQTWAKFKGSELSCMVRKSLLGGTLQWASGQNPMEGKMTLIREMTYSKVGEDLTWNLTMAQPEFIARKPDGNCKFNPTGVFEAGMVKTQGDNLILGGSFQHRRTPPNPMMGGGGASNEISLMAKYLHRDFITFAADQIPPTGGKAPEYSDGEKSMIAKASTSVMINAAGLSLKDITCEHHVKGGVTNSPQEMVAGLTLGQDPMPVQYGGTGGIVCNGYIGINQTLCGKPGKPKSKMPQQMPSVEEDTIIKAKLSTDGVVSTIIEGKLAPLPIGYGMRVAYDMFKDKLKYGLGITFSM